MTVLQAIILGIAQGFTEFLPISSSAHLFLLPYFFGWDYQGLGFDIALHWGTLLAVVIIFWKDYWKILKTRDGMFWFLVIGSIPAAIAGMFLREQAETIFRNPMIMVFTLSGFALLLWIADKKFTPSPNPSHQGRGNGEGEGGGELSSLNWKKALGIGVLQALAIIPGVSRSGSTITGGRFSGLNREGAVRFAFLLSGPIIFGAGLVAIQDYQQFDSSLIAGFLAAFVSGFLAIKFLLRFVSKNSFNVFVWYRLALAMALAAVLISR